MDDQKIMHICTANVGMFIEQCGEMAEKNWMPSQVEMLERLFGAVLEGCEYDEWEADNGEA